MLLTVQKKGTPVKSFIRFADATKEIRDHSPIERPHVIGVFHESLYQTVDVIKGLREDGIVVVNSSRNIDEVAKRPTVNEWYFSNCRCNKYCC